MLWAILVISIGAVIGYCLTYSAFLTGRRYALMKQRKDALARCNDGGFTNAAPVLCPCMCQGTLQADGRNKHDNLTFLICNECKCCYVARDYMHKAKASK